MSSALPASMTEKFSLNCAADLSVYSAQCATLYSCLAAVAGVGISLLRLVNNTNLPSSAFVVLLRVHGGQSQREGSCSLVILIHRGSLDHNRALSTALHHCRDQTISSSHREATVSAPNRLEPTPFRDGRQSLRTLCACYGIDFKSVSPFRQHLACSSRCKEPTRS